MMILVVDDSPTFLAAATDILEAEGFVVEVAKNGAEGVRMAKKTHPNMIIMDIEMPVLRGDEAVQQMRCDPETAHLPIIAMTSVSPETLGENAKLFNDYLVKPFGLGELAIMAKKHLG